MKSTPPGWPRISASLYYDDPGAAIDWLARAFGFEVRLRVDGEDGYVRHSELVFGDGLIMVGGTRRDPERDHPRNLVSPRSIGGGNTQGLCVHIDDVDAHCARARAAGAVIFREPHTDDYGPDYWADRTYGAIDPEGHCWWFMQRVRG